MLDWIAAFFEISGLWIVGNKKRAGFLFLMVGSILWIAIGLINGLYGLCVAASILEIAAVRNYFKWKKKENEKNN